MKTTIKSFGFAVLCTVMFANRASCQGMPVYDNTNFISLTKQLIESAKQTSQLLKSVEFLKKQKENIEKVNAVVRQLKAVRELTSNHQLLYEKVSTDIRQVLNSPYIHPDELTLISESFDALIDLSLRDLEFIDQVLSSDLLRMTDADRTQILREREEKSKEMLLQADQQIKRYRQIIAFRELQDKVNNRQVGF